MSNYGLQQLFEESVSAVTATNSVQLGTERWHNGKKYVYVYNKGTSTAAVKYGVVYSASSGYSVTVSSVSGDNLAGVVVHTQLEPNYYGWIATKGFVDLYSAGTSAIVVGDKIIIDVNGDFTRPSGGTSWTGMVCGIATQATLTAGTFNAYINVG